MPGPSPKPTILKQLNGNPGKQRLNDSEPQPRSGVPDCPAWIIGEALAEWNRVVPELQHMSLLTLADRAALASYCQAWAELVECTEIIQRDGRVVNVPVCADGVVVGLKMKAHPIVAMQRDAFARVKSFLGLFGLSPADRVGLNVKTKDDKPNPLLRFMNGGRG